MNPFFQRAMLVFIASGLTGVAALTELSAYTAVLTAIAGLLTGKALLSKPGEGPRVPPAG